MKSPRARADYLRMNRRNLSAEIFSHISRPGALSAHQQHHTSSTPRIWQALTEKKFDTPELYYPVNKRKILIKT